MGGKQSKNKLQNNEFSNQNQRYYDQIVQFDECCGFQKKKIVRKGLIWQENFFKNCVDLYMYYQWIHDIQQVVKLYGRKLPRKKFIDQYNNLRIINRADPLKQDQILLSPSQIDQFKVNLKSSVLLSYGQAIKPPRAKQISRIQSLMCTSTANKNINKNLSLSNSFSNTPLRSSRKRSEFGIQQIRKQSILRERERTLRQQSFSKSGFRQSILSFVDDTMTTMFRGHQKQISKQSAHALQVFIKFSLVLQKHLTSKQNIINAVIEAFNSYIYKKYPIFNKTDEKSEMDELSQKDKDVLRLDELQEKLKTKVKKQRFKMLEDRKNLTPQQIQDFTNDIKIFLVLLKQMVQDYYKTTQFCYILSQTNDLKQLEHDQIILDPNYNTNNLIINEDNILILVTSVLFKNQKFYNHIISIFKKYNEDRQKNFKKILQELVDRPPQYFEIKKQYCLNDYTIDKFSNDDKKQVKQTQQNTKTEKQTQTKQKTRSQLLKNSYDKCTYALQKLSKSKSPTSKMKVIMQCSEKITESIAQFYNNNGLQLKNQVLDADQVLSIFCYVLATSSLQNIHSNLFIIEHFATENQMISMTGYYYSVLTIAVEQLENMYSSTVADLQSFEKTQSYANSKAHSTTSKASKGSKKRSKSSGKTSKVAKQMLKRSFKVVEQ